MTNDALGLAVLFAGGIALVAYSKTRPKDQRLVLTWRKNPDGSCTYTYDDGSQETNICSEPPA